jgi:hypothetical protein
MQRGVLKARLNVKAVAGSIRWLGHWRTMKNCANDGLNTMITPLIGIGVMGAMLNQVFGGMGKMFGENIPEGVVKELMQGVMDGLISYFDGKIE